MFIEVLIGAGASVVGALIGATVALAIASRSRARQYKLEDRSEALVHRLLSHKKWRVRTFKTISFHVAGFDDNELRRILVRSGAVRFEDVMGVEVWGLLERNIERLEREEGTSQN